MDKPRTTWKERVEKDDGEGRLRWCECMVCHQTAFMFATLDEAKSYVCLSCRADWEKPVSIRCRRHKKRFNVPEWWTEVCGYLCPKCYEKLTVEERLAYAPDDGACISVRDAEGGKEVVRPTRGREEYLVKEPVEEKCDEQQVEVPVEKPKEEPKEVPCNSIEEEDRETIIRREYEKFKARLDGGIVERKSQIPCSNVSDNPNLADLLPRYRIHCQKCGEDFPCNYTWFDTSTVLCPKCYGSMSQEKIELFHSTHHAEKPKLGNEKTVASKPVVVDYTPCRHINPSWTKDSASVNSGGRWSNSQVMRASKRDLLYAVKIGKVSVPRMRIELSRRRNKEYFDMLPDEVGLSQVPFSS